jgi:hypothetical protein
MTGTWRLTAEGLDNSVATLLLDGRVLVVGFQWREGGPTPLGRPTSAAGLYDPAGDTWTPVTAPDEVWTRTGLATLPDGRVLLVGTRLGQDGMQSLALVYDVATNTWSPSGAPGVARAGGAMVPLPDGRVLVAGGGWDTIVAAAEVYDPISGAWRPVGSMTTARNEPTAAALADGRVLVSGGHVLPGGPQPPGSGRDRPLASAEVFDPSTGQWSDAEAMQTPRVNHSLTLLPDGRVLAVGGSTLPFENGLLSSAEIYDPIAGTWSATGDMAAVTRDEPSLALLALAFFMLFATGVFGLMLGVSSAPLRVFGQPGDAPARRATEPTPAGGPGLPADAR